MQRLHHRSPSQARQHCTIPVLDNPSAADHKRGKKRGSYNCGRCGLPKKGHVCHLPATATTPTSIDTTPITASSSSPSSGPISSSLSVARQPNLPPRHPVSHLRRALSFDDVDSDDDPENPDRPDAEGFGSGIVDPDPDMGGLPGSCLWEVMRRLSPRELSMSAGVCKGWREMSRRVWRAAEKLRLRVPAKTHVGFVASVLQKCPGLVKLSLRMERLGFNNWILEFADLGFLYQDLTGENEVGNGTLWT